MVKVITYDKKYGKSPLQVFLQIFSDTLPPLYLEVHRAPTASIVSFEHFLSQTVLPSI